MEQYSLVSFGGCTTIILDTGALVSGIVYINYFVGTKRDLGMKPLFIISG